MHCLYLDSVSKKGNVAPIAVHTFVALSSAADVTVQLALYCLA